MLDDFRAALRQFCRHPGFSIIIVLTLSVGIGLNIAAFSVVNAILLRPLLNPDADRVVTLQVRNADGEVSIPAANRFVEWRQQRARSIQSIEASLATPFNLTGGVEVPRVVRGARVTAGFFDLHRMKPVLGRLFRAGDDEAGRPDVVVLSQTFWFEEFGGDMSVVGRTVTLNEKKHVIVGIAPSGALPLKGELDLFAPLVIERHPHMGVNAFARLSVNTSIQEAKAEMAIVSKRLQAENPGNTSEVIAEPLGEPERRHIRPTLLAAFAATGLVLLIACANVAGVLLARGFARRHEYSIRLAVGATRGRLAAQAMAESVVTAALSLVVALYGARVLIELLSKVRFGGLDGIEDASVDGRVLVFAVLLSIFAPMLASFGPALSAAAGMASSRRSENTRRLLVIMQVAASFLLVTTCGLLVQSLWRLQSQALGYETRHLLGLHVRLPDDRAAEPGAVSALHRKWKDRVAAVPGVESVGLATRTPLTGSGFNYRLERLGVTKPGHEPVAEANVVDEDYFRTMRIPFLAGRGFTAEDRPGGRLTVVICQAVAQRLFPGRSPIGHLLDLATFNPTLTQTDIKAKREIIGVVGDVKQEALRSAAPLLLYFPSTQNPYRETAFLVRAIGDPEHLIGSLRRAIAQEEPDLPVFHIRVMETEIARILTPERHGAALVAGLAGLALLLAMLGAYGVLSYSTTRRTREFGIRIALGASASSVFRLVLGEAVLLCLAGVGIGLACYVPLNRLLDAHLFGIASLHPATLAGAAFLILAAGSAAAAQPARRAGLLAPGVALRIE